MNTIILGIDPGFTGAICAYNTATKDIEIYDMPLRVDTPRSEIDLEMLSRIFKQYYGQARAAVEDVGPNWRWSKKGIWSFGEGFGILKGMLKAYNFDVDYIRPQDWKKAFNLIKKDKPASIAIAKKLSNLDAFRLKKHHGRAESFLIAYYAAHKRINLPK